MTNPISQVADVIMTVALPQLNHLSLIRSTLSIYIHHNAICRSSHISRMQTITVMNEPVEVEVRKLWLTRPGKTVPISAWLLGPFLFLI